MRLSNNLKRLKGNLNYDNIKRGIEFSKRVITGIRGINQYANDTHNDTLKHITDKIIQNKGFNTFEKGISVGDGLTKVFDKHKNGGLLNPVSEEQKQITAKIKLPTNNPQKSVRERINDFEERRDAERIASNVK